MLSRNGIFSAMVLSGAVLVSTPASASTIPLLSEDFNDVTISNNSHNPLGDTDVRTVDDIVHLSSNQLPVGTIYLSILDAKKKLPDTRNNNVRAASNDINKDITPNKNDARTFDGFFKSQFLVIGDNQSDIGDPPDVGDSGVLFPIVMPKESNPTRLRIQFDYAFDGKYDPKTGGDDFFNALLFRGNNFGDKNNTLFAAPTLLSLHISDVYKDPTKTSGHFDQFFNLGNLPGDQPLYLGFILREVQACDCTNTAVGIDNIVVDPAPVPVPAAVWLFGSALAGMAGFRRRAL